jgi:hypothetical protein
MRVNVKIDFFGIYPTQAEIISFCLMIAGVLIWLFISKKYRASTKEV